MRSSFARGGIQKLFLHYAVYGIFLAFIAVFSLLEPRFLSVANIINILQQAAPLGIAAIGMTFILLTANIDISMASTMFLSATASAFFISKGGGILGAIVIAVAAGGIVGVLNGLLVARFGIVSFIATLAMMGIAKGAGLAISQSKLLLMGNVSRMVSSARPFGVPITVFLFLALLIIGDLILRRTQFGRQLFAIGGDRRAARMVGIPLVSHVFISFVICGLLAGLAGFITAAQVSAVNPNLGSGDEFVVISAVVLGGTSLFGGKGSVLPGTLIGIITIVAIINGLTLMNASPFAYPIVKGFVIFLVVMVDSINNKGELR
ncbi:MAG: ABC transporter permease [Spirochaetota bacterium]